jgi:hypothetical protein
MGAGDRAGQDVGRGSGLKPKSGASSPVQAASLSHNSYTSGAGRHSR